MCRESRARTNTSVYQGEFTNTIGHRFAANNRRSAELHRAFAMTVEFAAAIAAGLLRRPSCFASSVRANVENLGRQFVVRSMATSIRSQNRPNRRSLFARVLREDAVMGTLLGRSPDRDDQGAEHHTRPRQVDGVQLDLFAFDFFWRDQIGRA